MANITDPSGVAASFTHDAHGRLEESLNALGLPISRNAYRLSRSEHSDVYQANDPNRIRTTSFQAVNLLSDPSMETTSGSDSEKWRKSTLTTGAGSVDATTARFGKRSLKASVSSTQRVLWDAWYEIAVDDAESYRMSVWAKTSGGYTGEAFYEIYFRTASNAYAGAKRITIPAGNRDWTFYETTFTPPSGATKAYAVYLNWSGDGSTVGTIWWDGAAFEHLPGDRVTTEFVDSRGLSIQRHERDGGYDIIAATEYDAMGRVTKTYKPYRIWNSVHNFTPYYASNANSYYDGNPGPNAYSYPYEEREYDNRGRLSRIYGVGLSGSRDYRSHYYWNERARDASWDLLSGYYAHDASEDEIGAVASTSSDALGRTVLSQRHVDVPADGSTPANTSLSASSTGGMTFAMGTTTAGGGNSPGQGKCGGKNKDECDGDDDGGGDIGLMDVPLDWDYDVSDPISVTQPTVVRYDVQISISGTAQARLVIKEGTGGLRLYSTSGHHEGYFVAYPGTTYEVRAEAGTSSEYPGNASVSCDVIFTENGRVTTINTTRLEPDIAGNPVKVMPPNYFDPPSGSSASDWEITYDYDTRGRLLSKTTPDDGTTKFKYDEAGNVRFRQDAKQAATGKVLFTTYDAVGRPLVTGEASATFSSLDGTSGYAFENTTSNWRTVHAYDAKPSTGSFPWNPFAGEISGADMHYLNGRLAATAQRSDGVWQIELFSYDDDGRLERRYVYTDAAGAVDAEIAYRYDRQGNLVMRTSEVDPYSRRFRQWYEYDERGLLERVFAARSLTRPAQPEVTYTYTATGAIASVAFRGSSALPYTYNSRDWLTGIGNVAASSGSFAAAYLHEANGQIAESEYRQYASPSSEKRYKYVYRYDKMGRLLEADFARRTWTWQNVSYFDVRDLRYDANGNITSLQRREETGTVIDDLTFGYTPGTNRLYTLTDAAGAQASWDASTTYYAHDPRGNLTYREDFGRSHIDYLTYDELNRLTEFKRMGAGPFTTAYRYSAGGERYWKKTAGQTGEYYVLEGSETVGVFREDGSYHWNILVGGAPVGRITNTGAVRFYVKDHLGSTRTVVNSAGTVVETRDFYPFGLQMPGRTYLSGTAAKEDFTGHELDVETGLHYAGARYLDAAIGRWLAVDPLADEFPGWSPYNYALNNPLAFRDPDGRAPTACPPFCGPAGQLFESKLSGLFDHSTFRTTQYVKGTVSTPGQVIGATDDFVRNYREMREANTIGADKYYHCKANCEAAQRGEAGEETATFLSALRELVDRFIKRDPAEASEADQQANRHGRENADTGECGDVCETFKPDTLDPERTNEDPLKEDERQ